MAADVEGRWRFLAARHEAWRRLTGRDEGGGSFFFVGMDGAPLQKEGVRGVGVARSRYARPVAPYPTPIIIVSNSDMVIAGNKVVLFNT